MDFLYYVYMDKMERNQRKKIIISVVTVMMFTTLFIGCTSEKKYTAALDLIEPELSDFDVTLQISNYTYEIDYKETEETSPIYDMTIPEYIFIRYIGVGEKKSVNFFAFKLDSIKEATEIFDLYKESYLEHASELEGDDTIGDQTFWCQISIGGFGGYGLEFRYANVVIVIVGITIELDVLENVAQIIEEDISSHME